MKGLLLSYFLHYQCYNLKPLSGRNPLLAIKLISDLNLYTSIFHVPPEVANSFSSPVGPVEHAFAAAYILHLITESRAPSLPCLHPILSAAAIHEPSTRPRLYLACALTPCRSITYEDPKKKIYSAIECAIREGTKLGVQNHYVDGIPLLFKAAETLQCPTIGGENERVRMGMSLFSYPSAGLIASYIKAS